MDMLKELLKMRALCSERSGLPSNPAPHQQLVTDGEGVAKWEDKPIYESYKPYGNLTGKSVSILGDSISTYSGYIPSGFATWYPNGDINDVRKTWWKQLLDISGLSLLVNASWSGSCVSRPYGGSVPLCNMSRINALKGDGATPDIIITFAGINDFGLNVPVGEWNGETIPAELDDSSSYASFSEAYAVMVSNLMKTYPKAEIYCATILDTTKTTYDDSVTGTYPTAFENSDGTLTTLMDYNHAIRHIAEALGANVLDMHSCGITYFNAGAMFSDGLHPNAAGAKLMASKALAELTAKSIHMHPVEKVTWYINVAETSSLTINSGVATAPYCYVDANTIAKIQNKPINVIKMKPAKTGVIAYGKFSKSAFVQLGTLTLGFTSNHLVEYDVEEFTLGSAAGENFWFASKNDTGLFKYGTNGSGDNGTFGIHVGTGGWSQVVNNSMGVDLGYKE